MSRIDWPEDYRPGTTDNFVSNEIIVKNLSANDIGACFIDTRQSPEHYGNVSDIHFYDSGPALKEGSEDKRLDVLHAWLFEDLPGNRVRILTQESQIGKPARDMAGTLPNPMLNAHQEWIVGLATAAPGTTQIPSSKETTQCCIRKS